MFDGARVGVESSSVLDIVKAANGAASRDVSFATEGTRTIVSVRRLCRTARRSGDGLRVMPEA